MGGYCFTCLSLMRWTWVLVLSGFLEIIFTQYGTCFDKFFQSILQSKLKVSMLSCIVFEVWVKLKVEVQID